jgi:hypothetical protein
MNLRQRVWLPPDGDSRLVRFQETLARACGVDPATLVPPYLALLGSEGPWGPVRAGAWDRSPQEEPVLGATDDRGPVGFFRFDLPPGQEIPTTSLPPPPAWIWTRGRTATLVLETPQGDRRFILWSWESLAGWRADRPRG